MINPFSLINRYLFLEMLPPFLINLAFFSFIFLMKQILDITDMIVNHHVGVGAVCLLLIYTMPYFLQYVIPMSTMMAILMALLRMSGDNEIMALKAGGVSIYRLLTPVLTFSVMGMLVTGFMTIYGLPSGAERFKALLFDVATSNLSLSLKERTFNDNFKQIMLYVNKIDPRSGELHNVLIEDNRTKGINNTVVARSGRLFAEPGKMIYHLLLFNGTINQLNLKDRSAHTINFATYDIRLDIRDIISSPSIVAKTPDEMTLSHLRAYLKKVKANKPRYFSALVQYYKKFSIAFACLAMGLLALPLGVQGRHSKKSLGIGFGLIFFLLYYILLSVGTTLGETGRYSPLLAMWMPNVILGAFGLYLLVRSANEKPIIIYGLQALFDKATRRGRKK